MAASSVTVTEAVVPKATRLLEIVALIDVDVPPESIVTPEVEPFQRICALVAKFVPVAVNVNAGEPAGKVVGLIEDKKGVDPAAKQKLAQALTRIATSIDTKPVGR